MLRPGLVLGTLLLSVHQIPRIKSSWLLSHFIKKMNTFRTSQETGRKKTEKEKSNWNIFKYNVIWAGCIGITRQIGPTKPAFLSDG